MRLRAATATDGRSRFMLLTTPPLRGVRRSRVSFLGFFSSAAAAVAAAAAAADSRGSASSPKPGAYACPLFSST